MLRLAHGLRIRWWRLVRPTIHGCQVLAIDPAGRVLLVRHSYGVTDWTTPGGAIAPGEDPCLAAARELAEETGCRLTEARLLMVRKLANHGATNMVHLVRGKAEGPARADGREIHDAAFFAPNALPTPLAKGLARRLPGWLAEEPWDIVDPVR